MSSAKKVIASASPLSSTAWCSWACAVSASDEFGLLARADLYSQKPSHAKAIPQILKSFSKLEACLLSLPRLKL